MSSLAPPTPLHLKDAKPNPKDLEGFHSMSPMMWATLEPIYISKARVRKATGGLWMLHQQNNIINCQYAIYFIH